MAENEKLIFGGFGHFENFYPRKGDQSMVMVIAMDLAMLDGMKKATLLDMHTKPVWFLLAEAEPNVQITREETMTALAQTMVDHADRPQLPAPAKPEKEKKISKSQELRLVLLDIHKKQGGNEENFGEYYDKMMTQIIDFYKTKLQNLP